MKNTKKKIMTLVIALALVCSFILGASASSTLTAISAYLNYGITIEYNGETQQMFDANGVRIYPISYNGSTYIPVRAVANIFGENVDWDQAAKKVILGTPTDGVDLIETIQPYTTHTTHYSASYTTVQRSKEQTVSVAGISLNHWIRLSGRTNTNDTDVITGYYNLGGKYGLLTFQAYSTQDTTLEIRGDDDVVLASIPLTASQVPKTYTVPLAGTTQMSFSANLFRWNEIYIFDTVLK